MEHEPSNYDSQPEREHYEPLRRFDRMPEVRLPLGRAAIERIENEAAEERLQIR